MRVTYMQETAYGESLLDQRSALQNVGAPIDEASEPVYIDRMLKVRSKRRQPADLLARAEMLRACRSGDVVCVAGLERLGISEKDVTTILGEITRRGAAVLDAKAGKTYRFDPAVTELHQALRAAGTKLVFERTQAGRATAHAMGRIGGARPRLTGKARTAAKADWHNPDAGSADEIAKRHGVAVKTLYNCFGPRFPDATKEKFK
jgi:DNA invertase Pin-like site-specific DNA recombinase